MWAPASRRTPSFQSPGQANGAEKKAGVEEGRKCRPHRRAEKARRVRWELKTSRQPRPRSNEFDCVIDPVIPDHGRRALGSRVRRCKMPEATPLTTVQPRHRYVRHRGGCIFGSTPPNVAGPGLVGCSLRHCSNIDGLNRSSASYVTIANRADHSEVDPPRYSGTHSASSPSRMGFSLSALQRLL